MTAVTGSSGLVEHFLRLDPADIAYVKFVVESYEAVGFMRTVDREVAVIVLYVVPDFAEDGARIVDSLEREITLERLERPADVGDDWLILEVEGEPSD